MSNQKLAEALRSVLPAARANALPRHIVAAAEQALAEHDARPQGFTVCLQTIGDTGTTRVTFQAANTPEEAIELAKAECLADWDDETTLEDLHVFAVMRGDFDILQWDDQE